MGAPRRIAGARAGGRALGVPGGPHRRAPLLPRHQLERSPGPLVGAARDLEGRTGHLGRHRAGHPRRPAGAAPPRRRHPDASWTPPLPASSSPRPSGASATTSTRSSSAAPRVCPGAYEIDPVHRPSAYEHFATFQPTFLYELIWNLALAGALIWLGSPTPSARPGCSPSTSPATPAFASSRSSCASTPPITSSACG